VYVPEGPGPHPSVVVVHGGGWIIGHRRMKPVRLVATRLCRAGFGVCAVDHRLLFRGGGLAAQVEDVGEATRFFRAEAARFRCDPERISLLGFSAGAALALLHAGTSAQAYHRIVSIYGALDFDEMPGLGKAMLLRMLLGTADRRVWRERSPSAHALVPTPLLVIHGARDELVPVAHAQRLHEARVVRGLPSELEIFDGMPHAWLNDATLPETERAIERLIAFLRA
jgi:acetyl esterase/lipase